MTVKRYIITADDVVDNLTSTDTTVPLSAKQGNVLAGRTGNATTSTAGIVKVGSGISVSSGTISVPNATTSTKGIVQVGSGLSVSNGVISVSGSTVTISSIATSNHNGFACGSVTATLNTLSNTSYLAGSTYQNIGSQYSPIASISPTTSYPPFVIDQSASIPYRPLALTITCIYNTNYGDSFHTMTSNGTFQAVRVSDSSVLATVSTGNSKDHTDVTATMAIALPSDWTATDKIQFQGKSSQSSTEYGNRKYTVSVSSGTTITADAYYYPSAGA